MVSGFNFWFVRWILVAFILGLISCGSNKPLIPRTQTLGEVRAIRGIVTVAPPGESARSLLPRERLIDGSTIEIPPNALAWLRRDAGATLLLRGPANILFGAETLEVKQGQVFIDSPSDEVTTIKTPSGILNLVHVRASLDIRQDKETEVYVLAGEVRSEDGIKASPGERLSIANGKGKTTPAVVWTDWTGGLATTDRGAEPAPFGVGTVGARRPGDQGQPRVPLSIRRMDVRVSISGDLAVTEVDQLFFNGASDTVEGIYTFRTPEGASLNRFGVDREGIVVWGRVKEKKAAAQQYASHVYAGSKEDPALLEWDAPGVYRAKLYPIAPGATRRVVVRYTEWLPRTGPRGERRLYSFPMAAEGSEESLPHIEFFGATFDLEHAGAKEVRVGMRGHLEKNKVIVRAHDLVPRADLAVELFDEGVTSVQAITSIHGIDEALIAPKDRAEARNRAKEEQDYLLIPIRSTDMPRLEGGLDLVVVVDTSAGIEPSSLAIARSAVGALLAHLGEQDRALLLAGDATLRPVVDEWKELRSVNESARRQAAVGLATVQRGGATDLGKVLTQAAAYLDPTRRGALVYIGDGRPTVGELALSDLQERMGKLPRPVRVFGLGVGQDADMGIIEGLSKAGFAERLVDAADGARASLRLLELAERPAWLGVHVDLGPTVERLVPNDLDTLVADESVFLVGRLTGDAPKSMKLTTPAGEEVFDLSLEKLPDYGDLQSRWAMGRLRQLLADGAGNAALVDLGVRSGIITPFTSLYVPTKDEMTSQEWEQLRRDQRKGSTILGALDPKKDSHHAQHASFGLPLFFTGCSLMDRSAPTESAQASDEPTTSVDMQEAEEQDKDSILSLLNRGAGGPRSKSEESAKTLGLSDQVNGEKAPSPPAPPAPAAEQAFEAKADIPVTAPATEPMKESEFGAVGTIGRGGGGDSQLDRIGTVAVTAAPAPAKRVADDRTGARLAGSARVRNPIVASGEPEFSNSDPGVAGWERSPTNIVVLIGQLPHIIASCSPASKLPLADRVALWKERLGKARGNPVSVASVYNDAIRFCEAPTWAERSRLQSMMLDALPTVSYRVQLWRLMQGQKSVADALYRGILMRIRKTEEVRELHQALGLKSMDPGILEDLLDKTPEPGERIKKLRDLRKQWPHDFVLALHLLNALEDAGDASAARLLGRELRERPDADAHVLTEVGELYLRLSKKGASVDDEAEARRTFGEIVEYSPDEPVARRRLGDLLRSHGWFDEAARQYETLSRLSPDDSGLNLLHAASAQGLGKLDEAVRWAEKVSDDGAPGDGQGIARTARALAAVYLAWGRTQAAAENRQDQVELLRNRTQRLLGQDDRADGFVRAVLLWSHPALHPTLWSDALGAMMPAPEGDVTLGISQVILQHRDGKMLEVRMEKRDAEHAARLGASAILTVIFHEGKPNEKVVKLPISFATGASTLRFTLAGTEVKP